MTNYNAVENGKRLRDLRGERSLDKVASAVGITPSSLCFYESGKRNPRDEVKIALCRYYKVSVQSVFYPR